MCWGFFRHFLPRQMRKNPRVKFSDNSNRFVPRVLNASSRRFQSTRRACNAIDPSPLQSATAHGRVTNRRSDKTLSIAPDPLIVSPRSMNSIGGGWEDVMLPLKTCNSWRKRVFIRRKTCSEKLWTKCYFSGRTVRWCLKSQGHRVLFVH